MRAPGVLPFALLAAVAGALALGGGVEPLGAGLLGVVVALLGLAAAATPRLPALPPAALGTAAAWTALLLASLAWSASRDAALDGVTGGLALLVAWLLGAALVDARSRRRLALGLAALGVAVAAAALATSQPGERASFPLHNPNHLGAWLLLPAGLAAAALFDTDVRRRGARESGFLWFGVAGVVGAGLAASGSRGVALAAGAAVLAYLGLRLVGPGRGLPWLASGLAAAALLAVGAPLAAPDALGVSVDGSESSAGLRWSVYAVSARAALDAAPFGAGLGAFGPVFAAHRPDGMAYATPFAHNEALHGLVELGLPFAVAAALTATVLVRRARGRLERGGSRVSWGALVALVALAAHSLVDFPLHVPAIALSGAVLGGLLVAREPGAADRGPGRAVLAGLSALLLAASLSQTGAAVAERRAGDALARGEFAEAFAAASRGLRLRPGRADLHARAAEAAEHVHRFGGGGSLWLERALAARDAAVAADPADARRWLDRAHTRVLARELRGALADLAEAERRDPRSPVSPLARARLWLAAGRPERAAPELRRALQRHPRAAPDAVAAALRDTDDGAWVRAAVGGLGPGERDAAAVLARAGYWSDAAAAWHALSDAAPGDAEAAVTAAELLVRAGQPEEAARILARLGERAAEEPRVRRLRAVSAGGARP